MKPQPIIPWLGGKRRLARHLLPLFPPHECYVELFCGGSALYFLRPEPARVEVLNDLNGELVNLYRVVQNPLDEFIRQFRWALSSRQMFDWSYYERLAQAMRTMQGKAMLSINDHPDIRKAFGGLQMHEFPLTYTLSAGVGDRKGKEVVELAITN